MCPCVCVAEANSSTSLAASMACATSNSCHDIGQLLTAALIAVEKPKASPDSCCLGPVPSEYQQVIHVSRFPARIDMRSIILPYLIFCRLVGSWPKCNATFQGPLRQLSAAALTQIPQQASKDGHLHTKLQKESNPECSKIYFIMGRSWWESVNEIRPAKNSQAFPCNGIQFTTVYAVASVASHFEVAGPCLLIPKPKNKTKHPSLSLWDLAVCSNPKVALHAAPLARAHQATLHTKHPEWYLFKENGKHE